jgi:hypothetical protein
MSEPKGRGAAWTEERETSDEGRRRLKGAPEAHSERYAPMNAGLTIQDTTGLRGLAISPWGGLGVLAAWAAAALLAGGLLLRLRDA